jgi:putative flippase GtrA
MTSVGADAATGSERARFARFLVAGALAAGSNFGSRFVFSLWLPYPWAITFAFFVGLTTGFVLMRQFVFSGHGKPVVPQAAKFALVNALALAQTLVISLLLARWLLPAMGLVEHVEAVAHAFGVAVPVVTSYFGHRLATFR